MIEIMLALFAGLAVGTFTGLVPGIHTNTAVAFIISLPFLAAFSPLEVCVFIISAAVTHTFTDFIASIYIGCPDPATALSILPGHRMLLEGRGGDAIMLATAGGLISSLFVFVSMPVLFFVFPALYPLVKPGIPLILLAVLAFMVLSERGGRKKIVALLLIICSGATGYISLNMPGMGDKALFPLFTGLFGTSSILLSLKSESTKVDESPESSEVSGRMCVSGSAKGFLASLAMSVLPGLGASQATLISQQLCGKSGDEEFIVSSGAANTVVSMISVGSILLISKARSGAAVAIESLIGEMTVFDLTVLLSCALMVSGLAAILTLKLSRKFSRFIAGIDYDKVSKLVLAFLVFLTMMFSGFWGLVILFTCTALGLIPPLVGVKRSNMMGVVMIPVLIFYFQLIFGTM